jgi:deoxycytidylate deaminase
MKKLYKKTTVYVVRCDNNNNLQDSAPCQNCLKMLIELNIKRIVFSSKNDTFVSSNPKLLSPMHVSAGNKFINKKSNNDDSKSNNDDLKSNNHDSKSNNLSNNNSNNNINSNNNSNRKTRKKS